MRMSSWIALASVAFSSLTGHAVDVWLVKGGTPQMTIVLQAEANEHLKHAAEDLQVYVKELSGVELPITRDGQRAPGAGLYIGSCATTTKSDLPPPRPQPRDLCRPGSRRERVLHCSLANACLLRRLLVPRRRHRHPLVCPGKTVGIPSSGDARRAACVDQTTCYHARHIPPRLVRARVVANLESMESEEQNGFGRSGPAATVPKLSEPRLSPREIR